MATGPRNRRRSLNGTSAGALASCSRAAPGWAAANTPNILFILAEDIGETNNAAAAHPDLVQKMSVLLQRVRANGRSRPS